MLESNIHTQVHTSDDKQCIPYIADAERWHGGGAYSTSPSQYGKDKHDRKTTRYEAINQRLILVINKRISLIDKMIGTQG
jgi:hypothetical protein